MAVERAGAPSTSLPTVAELTASPPPRSGGAWLSLLWAAAVHVLLPSLAPEANVRAEVARLCAMEASEDTDGRRLTADIPSRRSTFTAPARTAHHAGRINAQPIRVQYATKNGLLYPLFTSA